MDSWTKCFETFCVLAQNIRSTHLTHSGENERAQRFVVLGIRRWTNTFSPHLLLPCYYSIADRVSASSLCDLVWPRPEPVKCTLESETRPRPFRSVLETRTNLQDNYIAACVCNKTVSSFFKIIIQQIRNVNPASQIELCCSSVDHGEQQLFISGSWWTTQLSCCITVGRTKNTFIIGKAIIKYWMLLVYFHCFSLCIDVAALGQGKGALLGSAADCGETERTHDEFWKWHHWNKGHQR